MAHAALRTCTQTKGNARLMNLSDDKMQTNTFLTIARQFASKGFGLHLFVPQIYGAPAPAEIKRMFGEAEEGPVQPRPSTATLSIDNNRWQHFKLALQGFLIVDFASFDFGLATVTIYFITSIDTHSVNGLPFCVMTREWAKQLAAAQEQRQMALSHYSPDASSLLSHVGPPELRRSRLALMDWDREQQALQDVQFQRSLQQAIDAGLVSRATQQSGPRVAKQPKTQGQRRQPSSSGARGSTTNSQGKAARPTSKTDAHSMDKAKWTSKHGTAADGSKLCWWHSHSNRPCSRQNCPGAHKHPSSYQGKHFSKLGKAAQASILADCKK
jgi:hypothetical protein